MLHIHADLLPDIWTERRRIMIVSNYNFSTGKKYDFISYLFSQLIN
jgi:hypothetical protein